MKNNIPLLLIMIFIIEGCNQPEQKMENINEINSLLSKFAPVEIKYDSSHLNSREKVVVEKLFKASKIIDTIFLKQVFSGNEVILDSLLAADHHSETLHLFQVMMGPFDRLNDNKAFIGKYKKPAGANFYPEDMSKEEFNKWITEYPEDREKYISEFTVIRRENGKLTAIPYSEFYKKELKEAADLLREAADYSDNLSLKKYLKLRADAFESNNYFDSDVAWMDLKDHTIEIVIGPYEVYEDELFNYKASFESFLTLKDSADTEKLKIFAGFLDEFEENLPLDSEFKNYKRGSESPIVVANEIFSAGDTKAGVQTLAFNLPNDERVRKLKGSKKVMLKNIHEAKFEKILKPIAAVVLGEDQVSYVTFNAFFSHTLMHEMSHGIGPGYIVVNGKETEVKKELRETYSKIEECKADILGILNNLYLIEKRVYDREFEKEIWATNLAGIFRSVRFGITEAHGAGNAIIYNYLLEKNAFEYDNEKEKVRINFDYTFKSLKDLAEIILTIQATGDYEGAINIIKKYAIDSPSLKTLREKLKAIPVDIKPVFEIEKMYD